MVRAKLVLMMFTSLLVLCSAGIWFFISGKETVRERRANFFETSKSFPTSGGGTMKVEW